MREETFQIADLIGKHIKGTLTEAERNILDSWTAASPENRELFDRLSNGASLQEELSVIGKFDPKRGRAKIAKVLPELGARKPAPIHKLRWKRIVAAAAVLSAVMVSAYFLLLDINNGMSIGGQPSIENIPVDRPVLTLMDGTRVLLDTASDGTIANQNGVQIIKLGNGELMYGNQPEGVTGYNTLTTPRGGIFRVKLPDGTDVWLNSASSLRFPTAFNGDQREVTLSGEAYFDVRENSEQPFIVKAGLSETLVLGTAFNIMAYTDEQTIRTTLVSGSVRVQTSAAVALLKPGMQSVVSSAGESDVIPVVSANIEEATAWKEGKFWFDGADIESIMRQLSRWYDVEVIYDGAMPKQQFYGVIPRKESAGQILEALEIPGKVHFTVEGKKITVHPGARKK